MDLFHLVVHPSRVVVMVSSNQSLARGLLPRCQLLGSVGGEELVGAPPACPHGCLGELGHENMAPNLGECSREPLVKDELVACALLFSI